MTPSSPDIILYGGPGSGKSTQAANLVKKLKAQHLNAGGLLRELSASRSAEGKKVKKIIEQGKLAPRAITNNLVKKFISKVSRSQRIVFDGYPRDAIQMRFLDKLLKDKNRHAKMLYIKLPITVAKARLLRRAKIEHRTDDLDPKALTSRINIFNQQAKILLAHYRKSGLLITINGNQTMKQVEAAINKAVAKC